MRDLRSHIGYARILSIRCKTFGRKEGRKKTVRELMEMGGNVHEQDTDGDTPLHMFPFFGQEEAVKELVQLGSVVHTHDAGGFTPLQMAADGGYVATVRWQQNAPGGGGIDGLGGFLNSIVKWLEQAGHS
jgi:ankyrin repeat protein